MEWSEPLSFLSLEFTAVPKQVSIQDWDEEKQSLDTYVISLRAVWPEIDAFRRGELGRCVRKSSHLFGSRLGTKLSHRESMRPL